MVLRQVGGDDGDWRRSSDWRRRWASGRLAQSLLYQMKGSDPLVFALATVVLVLVALAAGYVPAAPRREDRSDAGAAL